MKESGLVHEACKWCYRGVWGILTTYFCLPEGPPKLPTFEGEKVEYLRPSIAFLNYRKFFFWIGLFVIDIILSVLWLLFALWSPWGALLTAPLWIFVIVVPDIVAYIAIHLRYDTTWYVLTDRSMRIRRGIWSIYETTITFENIQNVRIDQGPVQRWFGFANLMVMTAGGGGGTHQEGVHVGSHVGLLEGLDNAVELRERILARAQTNTGLGDEEHAHHGLHAKDAATNTLGGFLPIHEQLLREIYESTLQMVRSHNAESRLSERG
jgi:membrane protein YdbS with pleckstrin-like domain